MCTQAFDVLPSAASPTARHLPYRLSLSQSRPARQPASQPASQLGLSAFSRQLLLMTTDCFVLQVHLVLWEIIVGWLAFRLNQAGLAVTLFSANHHHHHHHVSKKLRAVVQQSVESTQGFFVLKIFVASLFVR